jgi:serine/threonine-protein kinase
MALVLIIGLSCALVLMLGGSGLAGYFVGLNDRQAQQAQEADHFFRKGLDDMAAGNLELAEADFGLVLNINPDYPGAAQQLELARQMMRDLRRVEPTATTSIHDAVTGLFVTARQAYNSGDWAPAIAQLTQIRRIAPDYEPDAVEQLLFTASYTYGLELLDEDRLEEGVFHLEQAAKLRPLDADAAQQAEYAKMYLTARGYWNVNWDLAIERFGELVAIAPNYKDAYARYVEAYIVYADAYVDGRDYCPAQPLYQQALALRPDASVQDKLDIASAGCLSATPVPLTSTIPISGTPVAVPGLNVGRLAYPVEDAATGATAIYAISAGGSPFVAAFGGQPAWQPNGSALAYRVLGVGISTIDLATGGARSVAPAGSAWPSWSPDGNRLVYAQRDTTGEFRLMIAALDGSTTPIDIGPGESPVWGPSGILAYKGCDGSGCGILVDDPNDPGPPVRLTSSPQDIPTSWSPDGFNIAYFSNADGDWDIYFVNTSGGVAQVVNAPGNDGLPAWSPDGAHLAFASDRDGSWAIYIVNFDGAELIKAIELGPSFSNWNNERLAWAP